MNTEQELLKLIGDLRAENAALLEIILAQAGLLDKEIIVPPIQASLGKEPWYKKKHRLEKHFSKSESGPEKLEVENASEE